MVCYKQIDKGGKEVEALSPAQQHVIDRMEQGWELGMSRGFNPSCWLQKNGIGRGGETEHIRSTTLDALFKKGLVRRKGNRLDSIATFELTK